MWDLTDQRSQQAWEKFRRRVAELGGVVLEPEWLGVQKPHRCRCAEGHECAPRPGGVINNGQGICRTCGGRYLGATRDDFYRRVAELGGEVLEPEWLGNGVPHRCRCANGHECRPRPASVQQGQGICLTCGGKDPVTSRDSFYRQVDELGGIVLEQRWLGTKKPHLCWCANGHECRPLPDGVLNQNRGICRICAGNDPAAARENFYARVAELGGVVLEQRWLGNRTPHRCLCATGHECRPRPNNVTQGLGMCRICSWRTQDALYVTRNPVTSRIKFGITSHKGTRRLGVHYKNGFTEVVCLKTGLPEYLAAHVEQKIKAALEMAGAKPVQGLEYYGDEHIALILNEIGNWIPAPGQEDPS